MPTNFGPEVKQAMDEPPTAPRARQPGQLVNRAERKEVVPGRGTLGAQETRVPVPRPAGMGAPIHGDIPHIAAATSIAHAILNKRGVG